MTEQEPFASRDELAETQPPEKKEGLSGCAIAGIGCGIVLLVLLILGGLAAWWVAANARTLGTDFAAELLKESLKELDLPPDQRTRIHARIDDVAQQFKEQKLTGDDVIRIFRQIGEGPLMPAGLALVAKRVYIRDSGLSDDEKAAAELAIHRFARGCIDESIPRVDREAVLDHIGTVNAQGNRQFKEALTDEELRTFVDAARQAADDAGVARNVPEINFADEFDKAIDQALGIAVDPALLPDDPSVTGPDKADGAADQTGRGPDGETGEPSDEPPGRPSDQPSDESSAEAAAQAEAA